jgi:uncharacterized protein (TIGR02145 family)
MEVIMKKTRSFLLTAGIVLAMVFTLSCSDSGGGEDEGGGDKGNDIKNYKTVPIGTQTWMAENLNYAVAGSKCYGEGGEVLIDYDENDNPITKKLSNAEVQDNCVKYGRLYDWATAMDLPSNCNENSCSGQIQSKHRGICPNGWHIPSDDDWEMLMDYVGGYETAGKKLKARSGWNENSNSTDEFGFSALPGGYVNWRGYFLQAGNRGYWWSTSEYEYSSDDAYKRGMYYGWEYADWEDYSKSGLLSVRCVKD